MASDILLAALNWHRTLSEEARKGVETAVLRAAQGADPLGAAEAEAAAYREAWAQWAQAKVELKRASALYASSKTEEDSLAVGHALLAFESATMHLRAARTACDCIAEALRDAPTA